ncbi:hypothetical protein AX16_008622 [Volvariella volvacea WC 439]|nr:hypothetical protein AX16_008622 [Volvariella volvacea WC 439]
MFLAGMFLAAIARSLASPIPISIPASPIPSPLCVVTAAMSAGTCDPNKKRTIFDILYSCLGVIFLCTYISIHHNIPDQNDSWARKTWLKVRTMLYAMVAPEIVIMWAIRQRIMAGEIANSKIGKSELLPGVQHDAHTEKEHNWTRTHAFFLQMGGLMIEIKKGKVYEVVRFSSSTRWTTGLRGASQCYITALPTIRKNEIQDHGKGDILAKSVVVLQTSWFIAQCIARRVEGLVLTELELVTLAFAQSHSSLSLHRTQFWNVVCHECKTDISRIRGHVAAGCQITSVTNGYCATNTGGRGEPLVLAHCDGGDHQNFDFWTEF